jgi:hypothetical protein
MRIVGTILMLLGAFALVAVALAVFGPAQSGFIVPTWVNPRPPRPTDVRQPVRTFTEPVSFRTPAARRLPATYILTVESGRAEAEDDFAAFAQRAKARGWAYHVLRANHVPERSAPRRS